MSAGRKPVPPGINAVRGNPGKRAQRAALEAPGGAPACPAHLAPRARAEWDRIVPELLALGVLSTVDRAALALYCTAYGRWEEAEEQIRERGGLVVQAPSGYPMQNPYLTISNRAMEQMHSYLSDFGLSPVSRFRVPQTGGAGGADPAEGYFTGPQPVR